MMHTFERSAPLPVSADEAFAWHTREGAFERLTPPWQVLESLSAPEHGLVDGSRREFRLRKGGLWLRWLAEHREVDPRRTRFVDVQLAGPFAHWEHRHELEPDGPHACILRDHIEYALPCAALGDAVAGRAIARDLERTFAWRHAVTRDDLALHARYPAAQPRKRVAVSGASGLLGRQLCALLTTGGHQVVRLVRGGEPAPGTVRWSPARGVEPDDRPRLERLDAVIHLAGESVAQRWTRAARERIAQSRIAGTRALVDALAALEQPPAALLSASGIGLYGDAAAEPVDERAAAGSGFLAELCVDWEREAERARALGCRVVALRIGVVLSPAGGALAKLLPVYRAGLGGPIAGGAQGWSWIGIDDAVGAIAHALLDPRLDGPVNLVAPHPVSQREFAATLGRVLARPARIPTPAAAVRGLFGQMGVETVLYGARVVPRRLLETDYEFRHPTLAQALRHVLGRPASADGDAEDSHAHAHAA